MNKAYSRINWENYPSTDTPLNETNLNHMDLAVDTIDDRVITLDTTKADEADLLTCVASISFNSTTGIMTITLKNGTQGTIDTGLAKLAINFDYDDDPTSPHYQQIILEMKDGTYKYIDLSALITQYEFTNSSTIAWTIGNDGTVSASVVDGSITADKLQPNYLADIILQVGKAQTAATNAGNSATLAESYAVGGTGTRTGEDTDNAKYYCEQAALIAGQTLGGLTDVTLTSPSDGQVLTYDSNSDEWVNRDVATDLADLGDVNLTTPTDGQALIYDGASQKWVNGNVTNKVATPVPKVKSYTYNGTDQTFEWTSLDTKHVTVTGDVKKNAGTYTVTATLKNAEDFWDDFTSAPKTFSWSIAKANQTFDLSANSVSLTATSPTASVNISNATGDGAFSASSSNTGVATTSVNGNVINITGVATGSATITVTKASTTNYHHLDKTISASVTMVVTVTLTLEGAREDTIVVKTLDDQSTGYSCSFNSMAISGTITMTVDTRNLPTYKFVSTITGYSKTVALNGSNQTIKVMPNGAAIWYGNACESGVTGALANGVYKANTNYTQYPFDVTSDVRDYKADLLTATDQVRTIVKETAVNLSNYTICKFGLYVGSTFLEKTIDLSAYTQNAYICANVKCSTGYAPYITQWGEAYYGSVLIGSQKENFDQNYIAYTNLYKPGESWITAQPKIVYIYLE